MSTDEILAEIRKIYGIEERQPDDVDKWQLADALGVGAGYANEIMHKLAKNQPEEYESLLVYDRVKRQKIRVLRKRVKK